MSMLSRDIWRLQNEYSHTGLPHTFWKEQWTHRTLCKLFLSCFTWKDLLIVTQKAITAWLRDWRIYWTDYQGLQRDGRYARRWSRKAISNLSRQYGFVFLLPRFVYPDFYIQATTPALLIIRAHLIVNFKSSLGSALSALFWCLAESRLTSKSQWIIHKSIGKV